MILEKGDMWNVWGKGLWLFPANAHQRWNGELTMGAGLAKEVKDKWPRLPSILGAYLRDGGYGDESAYGVCVPVYVPGIVDGYKIGAFQTKFHWKGVSSLALIGFSVTRLRIMCKYGQIPRVDLAFPGIGCGGLKREAVLPIISELPDAVHIWERE